MSFEFPTAPAIGDDYTIGGIVYTWTGTNWDIKGGNDPQDFILRAGDAMTGPLGLPEMVGPTNVTGGDLNLMTNALEVKEGIIVARKNHIYAQGGGRFIFNNTDNNQWQNALSMNGGIHLQYHQGGNNDGRLRIFTSNGGYSDTWVMETTIVSSGPGINVQGQCEAGSFRSRGNSNFAGGINFGATVAASATTLSRHIILYDSGPGEYGFSVTNSRLNYVTDGTSAHHAFYCGATQVYLIDNVGTVGNSVNVTAPEALAVAADLGVACDGERGVDVMRAMAALLAKVKLLEIEIAALKGAR